MTHGDIWLPLDLNNPKGEFLYCEAWSDGYLDGVGLGAWSSSQKIAEIIELSTIFAGSPFFYVPTEDKFVAKEGDYLIEGYEDTIAPEEDEDNIVESAEETLNLIEQNKVAEALQTKFSKMSLHEKLDLELGINARIASFEDAWKNFKEDAKEITQEEAALICVSQYSLKKSNYCLNNKVDFSNKYFWKDEQFWTVMLTDKESYVIPLTFAHALNGNGKGCYGDMAGYLKDMTTPDKKSLACLSKALEDKSIPLTILFQGFEKQLVADILSTSKTLKP